MLSANTMPWNLREFSVPRVWCLEGTWIPSPSVCTHMYARLSTHPPQGDGPREHSDPASLGFQETIIFSWPQFLRPSGLKTLRLLLAKCSEVSISALQTLPRSSCRILGISGQSFYSGNRDRRTKLGPKNMTFLQPSPDSYLPSWVPVDIRLS